jgi:effector-binding domain-containing protein
MIVRISGEDQYELADEDAAKLNELDNAVVAIVESGREDGFADAYGALFEFVRAHGKRVADDELQGSDCILPPPDISFSEAGADFTGEGLIPD